MIKNLIILVFFIVMLGTMFNSMAYMGKHTPNFKKGLEQHLLRKNR